jgi:hypothetical protein
MKRRGTVPLLFKHHHPAPLAHEEMHAVIETNAGDAALSE